MTEAHSNADIMLWNIRTAGLIKAINYFVMRNEETFTGSDPPALSSAHAPAGRENRSKLRFSAVSSQMMTVFSLPSLTFPGISVDYYFFLICV